MSNIALRAWLFPRPCEEGINEFFAFGSANLLEAGEAREHDWTDELADSETCVYIAELCSRFVTFKQSVERLTILFTDGIAQTASGAVRRVCRKLGTSKRKPREGRHMNGGFVEKNGLTNEQLDEPFPEGQRCVWHFDVRK